MTVSKFTLLSWEKNEKFFIKSSQNRKFFFPTNFLLALPPQIFIFNFAIAVLGVNITLIFFGWILVISSLLLAYGTFKRQSRLCVPYIFAVFEVVLLVILLEILPEFIDNLDVGWFLLLNFLIGILYDFFML